MKFGSTFTCDSHRSKPGCKKNSEIQRHCVSFVRFQFHDGPGQNKLAKLQKFQKLTFQQPVDVVLLLGWVRQNNGSIEVFPGVFFADFEDLKRQTNVFWKEKTLPVDFTLCCRLKCLWMFKCSLLPRLCCW